MSYLREHHPPTHDVTRHAESRPKRVTSHYPEICDEARTVSRTSATFFVIVRCSDRETWKVIRDKGIPVSSCGNYGLLHNPVHLLGIEAAASIIAAARGGMPTSGRAPQPTFDLVGRATRPFSAGEVLDMSGHHHSIDGVEPLVGPAQAVVPGAALPFYLAANARLAVDVRPGEILTVEMVEEPADSALWRLRREQDAVFKTPDAAAAVT